MTFSFNIQNMIKKMGFKQGYPHTFFEKCTKIQKEQYICYAPTTKIGGGGGINLPLSVRSSVRILIHALSGYLLLQFWSYSFNILQDVYTQNGGVHVYRILIFIKYSQNDRQLDLVILFVRLDIDTWFVRLSPPTVLELQL